eukprot:3951312-Amphidinium_carterae.1
MTVPRAKSQEAFCTELAHSDHPATYLGCSYFILHMGHSQCSIVTSDSHRRIGAPCSKMVACSESFHYGHALP